jgi:hypothetical protein
VTSWTVRQNDKFGENIFSKCLALDRVKNAQCNIIGEEGSL